MSDRWTADQCFGTSVQHQTLLGRTLLLARAAMACVRVMFADPYRLRTESERAGWRAHALGSSIDAVPAGLLGRDRKEWRRGWERRDGWLGNQW